MRVFITDSDDHRPLRTLGADTADLESAFATLDPVPPEALAVEVDLYNNDERVRVSVSRALNQGGTEIVLWGQPYPAELECRMTIVEHLCSRAAQAFKAHAVMAAHGSLDSAGPTEQFLSGGMTFALTAGSAS